MKRVVIDEYIFGMSTVGRHQKPNFTVAVNPDGNRIGLCYFKYYDSNSYTSANCVARLNFRKPEKVIHKNRDGKLEWILNSHNKRDLCKYLDELSQEYRYIKITNWQVALYLWNNECGLLDTMYPESYTSRIEAFIDGFYDTEENLSNPSYVESTLQRPDYTQIEN